MNKPTLHLIGLFHTICDMEEFSHCAFTGKVFKFPRMMQSVGYEVIEYSNGESKTTAGTKVQILAEKELRDMLGKQDKTAFHGNTAVLGSAHWNAFSNKLKVELAKYVKDGDIICHPFGRAHTDLVNLFPRQHHVETGIGYPDADFGAHRIFETYAWMHYHLGKHINFDGSGRVIHNGDHLPSVGTGGKDYYWVVPNYFDLDDWTPRYEKGDYLLYFGRITPEKGIDTIRAIADYIDEPIYLVGQGNPDQWKHKNLVYKGVVHGKARDTLLRHAKALLMPTRYVEPFGGAGVEGMLCGTPLISTDYGCFAETVVHGLTGYRCHTLGDYLGAITMVNDGRISRKATAEHTRAIYSLEACAKRYDAIFQQIADLRRPIDDPEGSGWYHKNGHCVYL